MQTTLLKISCPDRVGLLARITNFVAGHGGNLAQVHQFTDAHAAWFFARLEIETDTLGCGLEELRAAFAVVGTELEAEWSVRPSGARPRVVLMVSKLGHCLADLLWRWRSGELECEIPCVISNHEALRSLVEREGIPFHHVPVSPETKAEAFVRMESMWREAEADLVVLARYMQVLPEQVCGRWPARVMNIHHSFLPSFVGANPYQRAYQRGGEAHRGDLSLCHGGSRPRAYHRTGGGPGGAFSLGKRPAPAGAGLREASPCARTTLPPCRARACS